MTLLRRNFKNSIQGWAMFLMTSICLSSVLNSCSKDEEPAVITPSIDSEAFFKEGINFTSLGGERTITFTTNKDWTITVASSDGDVGWCTASPSQGKAGENTVNIRAFKSEVHDSRISTFALKVNELTKNIVVTQNQKDAILPTTSEFKVAADGGTVEVEVKANVEYYWTISGTGALWIHEAAKSRGLTEKSITFTIDRSEEYNQRKGEITFHNIAYTGETITQIVEIVQEGSAILVLPQKEYTVPAKGGQVAVEMQSNFNCKVEMPQVGWITSASTNSISNRMLYYTIAPNTTYENRKAEIVFYDERRSIEELVTISQEGLALLIDGQSVELMVGSEKQLFYKINPNIDDGTLVWSSSDEAVATVTQEGVVTAVGKGTAIVTLSTGNGLYTATCEVIVYNFVDKIELSILGNATYINGYIIGSVYSKITNSSNETIHLETLEIYDGNSGLLVGHNNDVNKDLKPGESTNLGMNFNSVYLPIFIWTFTANGIEYEVIHQYPKPFL